jgi:cytidyltransferase-like protein
MRATKKYKHGLALGKFMPLHAGHIYLLKTAQENCQALTIGYNTSFLGPILTTTIRHCRTMRQG